MSTSPSPSKKPPSLSADSSALEILPFPYDEIASSTNLHSFLAGDAAATEPSAGDVGEAAREAQARELGRQEALNEARKSFVEQLGREREAITTALAQFTRDRAAYYGKVESEVVQLALSIARKILHREAQIDPLLLAGIVRVALEKIEGATGVSLRVHPQNAADWKRYLAMHMEPGDLPAIVEDPSLELDRCILQAAMGAADLGVEVQLKEIEHGLMDLLAARPGERS
jgi:flagellar assembly protein FliH